MVQITVVVSNGDHLTVNTRNHADLFWALRGGGGGTFGVVTSVTYRTYPIVPVVLASLSITANGSKLTQPVKSAFTELVRVTADLTDAGWGGYVQFYTAGDTRGFSFNAIIPNVTWEKANQTILPYFDYVKSLAESTRDTDDALTVSGGTTTEWPSFWSLYKHLLPNSGQVGRNLELGSWLLPREALKGDYKHVAEVLMENPGLSYEYVRILTMRFSRPQLINLLYRGDSSPEARSPRWTLRRLG